MSKELEEAKIQIKEMIQNIQDSLDLDYLNIEQAIETCNKQKIALVTTLNYIDNSIPKEVVENKLNEQRSKVTNKCMYCNHNCDKYDVCTALQELLEVQNEK